MESEYQPPQPDPEAELGWLLQSCLDGEAQAFEELVEKLYLRVFSLLQRLGLQGEAAHTTAQGAFSAALLAQRGGGDASEFTPRLIQEALQLYSRVTGEEIGEQPERLQALTELLAEAFQFSPEQYARILGIDAEAVQNMLERKPDSKERRADEAGSDSPEPVLSSEEKRERAGALFSRFMEQSRQQRRRVRVVEAGWAVLVIALVAAGAYLMNRINSSTLPRGDATEAQAGSQVYLGLLTGSSRDPADEMFVALNPALNGASGSPRLSADGNTLVFVSAAANLVPHDTNRAADIFLYDRLADRIERINLGEGSLQADQESLAPVVSDDGRFTAFVSWASNLDPGDYSICPGTGDENRSCADIFLYDRETKTLARILPFDGENGRGHTGVYYRDRSVTPALALSGDGRYLAFQADVSNPGYATGGGGLFIHDLQSKRTWQVDRDASGKPANGMSHSPAFSGDGRYLAFVYQGSALGDNSAFSQVYLYDLQAGTLRRATQGMGGGGANANVHAPVLSQDGRYLVFTTAADNLVPGDLNKQEDVFLYDTQSGATQLVSLSTALAQANQASSEAIIAGDGHSLAYRSLANNLVAGDKNGTWDIFVFDRLNNTLELASLADSGTAADGPSSEPSLSADGRYLAFVSLAGNLDTRDRNGLPDVYLLDRATRELIWVSASGSGMQVALPAVLGPQSSAPAPAAAPTQVLATPTRTPLVTLIVTPTATPTVSSTPTAPVQTPTPPTAYPPPQPTLPLPTVTSAYPAP